MRRVWRSLVLPPVALLGAHTAPAVSRLHLGRRLCGVVSCVESRDSVALTFDDGPDRDTTAFLDLLDGAGARATFFVVGEQVERAPGMLREIVSRGHEVGIHCYRHRNHLRLTPQQSVHDMRRARAVIENVSGCSPRLYRPPYGVFSIASWMECGRQGWERVLWSRCGRDWETKATSRSVADRIGYPQAGDVLLLHDSDRYASPGSQRNALDALPIILERVCAGGLRARTVGELLDAGCCWA